MTTASATTHVGEPQVGHTISAFFQNDGKVTRRFTRNLGLRWDFQSQPVERNNGATNFDLNCRLPNGNPGCLVFAGIDGQPRNWRNEDYRNWGPRIGFAYDLFGTSRTILRGGYGILYPSQFWRENYGSANGFAQTSTTLSAGRSEPPGVPASPGLSVGTRTAARPLAGSGGVPGTVRELRRV